MNSNVTLFYKKMLNEGFYDICEVAKKQLLSLLAYLQNTKDEKTSLQIILTFISATVIFDNRYSRSELDFLNYLFNDYGYKESDFYAFADFTLTDKITLIKMFEKFSIQAKYDLINLLICACAVDYNASRDENSFITNLINKI